MTKVYIPFCLITNHLRRVECTVLLFLRNIVNAIHIPKEADKYLTFLSDIHFLWFGLFFKEKSPSYTLIKVIGAELKQLLQSTAGQPPSTPPTWGFS